MSTNVTSSPQSTPISESAAQVAGGRWRDNPERLAWGVLLASFTIFVTFLVLVPVTITYLVDHYMVAEEAQLDPTQGTLLLYPEASSEPIAVTTERTGVNEGSRIVAADDSTQGTVGLMRDEESGEILGSVQIYPGTDLTLERLRRPFFDRSDQPYAVRMVLDAGQARVFTNSGNRRPLQVELITPHGKIALGAGSYNIAVDPTTQEALELASVTDATTSGTTSSDTSSPDITSSDTTVNEIDTTETTVSDAATGRTEITVRLGEATLLDTAGEQLLVTTGLRAVSTGDSSTVATAAAEQNLVANGDFSQPSGDAWKQYNEAPGVENGTVSIIERDGRRVAHFNRQGEEGVHTEVGIFQEMRKDVNVYDSLTIQMDVRLLYQSLAGAGYMNSEFPLRVEIAYTDVYGKDLRWGHGFYYRDPEDPARTINDASKIPPYNWYTYQSPNLMELLAETRPARINSIRIYASGHNYQSMASEIYMLAE
jgi:hypothetical protein